MSQLTVYSDKAVVSMNYVLIRNIVMFARVKRLYEEVGGTALRQERKQSECRNGLS